MGKAKCHGHAELTRGCPECEIDPLRTRLREAEAVIANWERKEVERASCCDAMERRALAAEAKLEQAKDREQTDVDRIVYYRNLAIHLGAKPEHMQGRYDRDLCEKNLVDAETVDWMTQECAETWNELERAESRALAAELKLEQVLDTCHRLGVEMSRDGYGANRRAESAERRVAELLRGPGLCLADCQGHCGFSGHRGCDAIKEFLKDAALSAALRGEK